MDPEDGIIGGILMGATTLASVLTDVQFNLRLFGAEKPQIVKTIEIQTTQLVAEVSELQRILQAYASSENDGKGEPELDPAIYSWIADTNATASELQQGIQKAMREAGLKKGEEERTESEKPGDTKETEEPSYDDALSDSDSWSVISDSEDYEHVSRDTDSTAPSPTAAVPPPAPKGPEDLISQDTHHLFKRLAKDMENHSITITGFLPILRADHDMFMTANLPAVNQPNYCTTRRPPQSLSRRYINNHDPEPSHPPGLIEGTNYERPEQTVASSNPFDAHRQARRHGRLPFATVTDPSSSTSGGRGVNAWRAANTSDSSGHVKWYRQPPNQDLANLRRALYWLCDNVKIFQSRIEKYLNTERPLATEAQQTSHSQSQSQFQSQSENDPLSPIRPARRTVGFSSLTPPATIAVQMQELYRTQSAIVTTLTEYLSNNSSEWIESMLNGRVSYREFSSWDAEAIRDLARDVQVRDFDLKVELEKSRSVSSGSTASASSILDNDTAFRGKVAGWRSKAEELRDRLKAPRNMGFGFNGGRAL